MNRRLLLTAAVVLASTLAGCDERSSTTEVTSNPERPVELLFTKDGVKVYRFYSAGNPVYFTTPSRDISWRQSEGKTTVSRQTIAGQ